MNEGEAEALKQAEQALIRASTAFREAKDRVRAGTGTDEDVWPLLDARKAAYEHWRALADPQVQAGRPLSPEVLQILNEHRR
ncbi:hypothetical protein JCM19000A_14480 [Silvimonas sp. JCM 19000]